MTSTTIEQGAREIDTKVVVALLLMVAGVLTALYVFAIDLPKFTPRAQLHDAILQGTAESPLRYRVLAPFIAEGMARVLAVVATDRIALLSAYVIWDFASLSVTLLATYALVREWWTKQTALVMALLVALAMIVTFRDHYFHPWSLLEAGLFAAGLIAVARRETRWVVALTLLASLNRSTGLLIPLAYGVEWITRRHDGDRPRFMAVVAAGAAWVVPFVGLRLLLGVAPHVATFERIISVNFTIQTVQRAGLLLLLTFGVFIVLWLVARPPVAPFVARMWPVGAVEFALVGIFGFWVEVRSLMPLIPLLAVATAGALEPGGAPRSTDRSDRHAADSAVGSS